jgi:hypothetical protein
VTWAPVKDRGWRREAAPRIVTLCEKHSTWNPQYVNHLEEIVEFTVARVEGCMGMMPSSDCIVYFDRVPLPHITVTNPQRVEMAEKGFPILRTYLEDCPEVDSVPVVLRRVGGRFAVWDGHHRLRTYEQAHRMYIPAIVAWFVPGTGRVKVIEKREAAGSGPETGSPGPEPRA